MNFVTRQILNTHFHFHLFLFWRIFRKNWANSPWGKPLLNMFWNRCQQKLGRRMVTNLKFVASSHFPAWSPILPLRLARMMNHQVTARHPAWNKTRSIKGRVKHTCTNWKPITIRLNESTARDLHTFLMPWESLMCPGPQESMSSHQTCCCCQRSWVMWWQWRQEMWRQRPLMMNLWGTWMMGMLHLCVVMQLKMRSG